MIIKASSRAGGGPLARYLLAEHEHQQACVLDQRGSVMDNLRDTLRSWEAEAYAQTKGEKPLYHMVVRLAPGEKLHEAQWFKTLDEVENRLKLTDHPRVVVAHELNCERHLHVVYSRFDAERGILLNMGNDRSHMHATCRALEKEFGLRELESKPRRERNGNEKTRSTEHRMAKEAGTTRQNICSIVQAAWKASKTGREFQEQLALFSVTMTHGESRDYNVWHRGKRYDPVRLLEEVRTREFRAKMQIDPPRINEQGRASETGLISRAAKDLTRDQVTPQLANGERAEPLNAREAFLLKLRGQEENENPIRRRAEQLRAEQFQKETEPEAPSNPKPRRYRRKEKALAPRLRPKLFYGDPGI